MTIVNRNAVVLGEHLLLENHGVVGVAALMVMLVTVPMTVPMIVVFLLVFSVCDYRHPRSCGVPAPTRRAHAQLTSIDRIRNSRPASTSTSALPHSPSKNKQCRDKNPPHPLPP